LKTNRICETTLPTRSLLDHCLSDAYNSLEFN
jgi:hypothetical protein